MGRRTFDRDAAGLLTNCQCGQPDEVHYREVIPAGSDMHRLYWVVRQARLRGIAPRHDVHVDAPSYGDGVGLEAAWACLRVFMLAVLDLGWKPGLTLERRDNSRGYFPDNLTLATQAEQNRNRRTNHRLATGDVLVDAAALVGISEGGLRYRLRSGMSEAAALSTPVGAIGRGGRTWWKRPGRVDSPDQLDLSAVVALAETAPADRPALRRLTYGPSPRRDPRQLGLFPDGATDSEKPMAASDTARRVRSAGKRSKPLPASSDNSILSNGQSGKPTAIR